VNGVSDSSSLRHCSIQGDSSIVSPAVTRERLRGFLHGPKDIQPELPRVRSSHRRTVLSVPPARAVEGNPGREYAIDTVRIRLAAGFGDGNALVGKLADPRTANTAYRR
jgi:hypothetical protein